MCADIRECRWWEPWPLSGTTPVCTDFSIMERVESSEEWHFNVGGL